MLDSLDFSNLKKDVTWKALPISIILFLLISYFSLSIFGFSSSNFGVSQEIKPVSDFSVQTMNRDGIDKSNEDGKFNLSDHLGSIVILDFMSVGCVNCHYVQDHIEENIDYWRSLEGDYQIEVISIASWYDYESFEFVNETFGDIDSIKFMNWTVANGAKDSVILENGLRGDLVEYYSAQSLPLVIVIDQEGFAISKENSGLPLDGWEEFDRSIELAVLGDAESLRFGIKKADDSIYGVLILGLLLGVLVFFSPCAFPVLPSFITYYLGLKIREQEYIFDQNFEDSEQRKNLTNSFEIGIFAAFGQLSFFFVVGIIIFLLREIVNLTNILNDLSIIISFILIFLGVLMLLGWTGNISMRLQSILDKFQTNESDEVFTPRRNMYLWGIGYSAASVDCTAAAVFPFMAWLISIGDYALFSGLFGLVISVSILMISVIVIVGSGGQTVAQKMSEFSGIIKSIGAWMMIFAGIGLFVYLTQRELMGDIF